MADGGNSVGKISASAELDTSKFDAGIKGMGAAAEKLDPSLKRAEKSIKSIETAGKAASTSASFLQTTFTKLTASFATADLAVRAITTTLRGMSEMLKAAFTSPIKEAARFETVMAKVSTVVEGSTKQSVRALGDEVLELSRRFPKSKEELGIGLYNILQAGVEDTADAMLLLEAATKASIGGVTEVGTASKLLTQIMNGYNLTAEETVGMLDAVFVGAQEGSAEFSDLAASIGNTVNSAALLGVQIPEVVAAMEVMVNSGLSADEAATSLNRLFMSVIQASKGTGEAADLAKKMGLEFNSTALRAKGLQGFMADLATTVGDDEIAMQVLTQDVRGFRAAVALAGTGAGQFNELLADMENSAGATEQAFAKNADTLENFWLLAKNELIAVITQAGQESLPQLKDALTDVKGAIEENREEIREAVVALGTNLVGAIDTVVTHAPAIVQAIAQITEAIGKAISAGMWLVETLGRISGVSAAVQGVDWLRGGAADAQWKKTNEVEEAALDRTLAQFQKMQAAKRPAPAPILPVGPSAAAGGGGGGGSGAKENEKRAKEMERIEKDIAKAIGDQGKEAKELLENRKEELELKREMGVITEKETRELGRILSRVDFLDDKVDEATDAWRDHRKEIEKSTEAVSDHRDELKELSKDLAEEMAEIDKDLERRKTEIGADSGEKSLMDAAELIREREEIRRKAEGSAGLTGDMSRRLGEIDESLVGYDTGTLDEASRVAAMSPAELEARDQERQIAAAEADAERRRQDAIAKKQAREAEIRAELEAEEAKLAGLKAAEAAKIAAVQAAANERLAIQEINFAAVEDRTRTHVDTLITEYERLRAAQNMATSSPSVSGYASGGAVYGPGTGTSDEINARLSNGEHVLTAADVRGMGGHSAVYAMRDAIRSGLRDIPRFAEGGAVTSSMDQSFNPNVTQNFYGEQARHRHHPSLLYLATRGLRR